MVVLPADWKRCCAGHVAVTMVRSIASVADRIDCSTGLIWAALRLWAATDRRQPWHVRRVSRACWRAGNLRYHFIPEMDDPSFFAILKKRTDLCRDVLIVPIQSDFLFARAISAELNDRRPQIFSVDSFLNWRALCASLDARRSAIVRDLMAHYNQCVREVGRDDLIVAGILDAV